MIRASHLRPVSFLISQLLLAASATVLHSSSAFATVKTLDDLQTTPMPNFSPVTLVPVQDGFLSYFNSTGQPLFDFHKSVAKRFGARLNQGVDANTMSTYDRTKWTAIYNEMVKSVNRMVTTPTDYLVMDLKDAVAWSEALEKTGSISPMGAWSIAVQGTAARHGFSKTPCAEFQSENVREAYVRAGYNVTDDFNTERGNQLIWSNSAAVVKFSENLYLAGWVPWETKLYRAPIGAIMMNGAGETPGHTFISAGADGRLIVDNGSPQGRDLGTSLKKTIGIEYEAGVFFLPPGIQPTLWSSPSTPTQN